MAGKSGKYTVLILAITALALIGCSYPMGSIGSPASSRGFDGLLLEFSRTVYAEDELFELSHLKVYVINRLGERQRQVHIEECEVRVIEDPEKPEEKSEPVTDDGYEFESIGEKVILVEYNYFTIQYSIEVKSGTVGGQTSGIQIIWAN